MKIILATSNKDKVKEIKAFYKNYEIYALNEIMQPFEIKETGSSFKENALIKVNAVYKKLEEMKLENEFMALSDDSGICVDILGGAPGIYSARYSNDMVIHPTDESNRAKLISELHKKNVKTSPAHYTACIALSCKSGNFTTHGFMHGRVIDEERGNNGFGYDFIFIANGFSKTIGELDKNTKLKISHRSKGLFLMSKILKILNRSF